MVSRTEWTALQPTLQGLAGSRMRLVARHRHIHRKSPSPRRTLAAYPSRKATVMTQCERTGSCNGLMSHTCQTRHCLCPSNMEPRKGGALLHPLVMQGWISWCSRSKILPPTSKGLSYPHSCQRMSPEALGSQSCDELAHIKSQ